MSGHGRIGDQSVERRHSRSVTMPYLPDKMPPPEVTATSEPFWQHCAQRRLTFQACGDCGEFVHPPLPVCPRCQSLNRTWHEAPAAATVFSFTWIHTAAHDAVAGSLPYNVVLVEFPGLPGVRLVSNVIDVAYGEIHIGDRLILHWEKAAGDLWLPRFLQHMETSIE
jgi:uncharacterized OB-fold protein